MGEGITLQRILKKERLITTIGLFLLFIFSWLYIIYLYKQMYPMNMDALFFAMPMTADWTLTEFTLLFVMWFVMMIAMMIPSVSPLILIFISVSRKYSHDKNPLSLSWYLLAGYFLVWCAFSLLATFLQWTLQQISLLNPEMETTSQVLGGIILITSGIFQFTSLKRRCLKFCQSPLSFLQRHWRYGKAGALKMGIQNGIYCLGCCWILMILLFVSGIMNILWIAIISIFILIEKVFPRSQYISYLAGGSLVIFGFVYFFK
jgi:predicted metal-binding membrane protein